MICRLLVPNLLLPMPGGEEPSRGLALPALETLLARGVATQGGETDAAAWLCRAFGVAPQPDWPVASFGLLGDGGEPGGDYWLRADPAHLETGRDHLVLAAVGHSGLTQEEAAAIAETLNRHFAADGMAFFPRQPDRWYLRLAQPPALQTFPPAAAIDRDIHDFLPNGADGMHWRSLLNEIQMLLHDHPVNEAREQRGLVPINSLWLWGGGCLPQTAVAPCNHVWADDPLARGLAMVSGVALAARPPHAAAWLSQAGADGSHLLVLDQLAVAWSKGGMASWQEALQQMERDWFAPLRQMLAQGRLAQLSLSTVDGPAWEASVTRGDLWKLWRRKKKLAHYLAAVQS